VTIELSGNFISSACCLKNGINYDEENISLKNCKSNLSCANKSDRQASQYLDCRGTIIKNTYFNTCICLDVILSNVFSLNSPHWWNSGLTFEKSAFLKLVFRFDQDMVPGDFEFAPSSGAALCSGAVLAVACYRIAYTKMTIVVEKYPEN
jgi:hypothetical protein